MELDSGNKSRRVVIAIWLHGQNTLKPRFYDDSNRRAMDSNFMMIAFIVVFSKKVL